MECQSIPKGLQPLVDRLANLRRPATIAELREWLNDLKVDRDTLTPFVRFQESCYSRNPVASTEFFELLCICWKSGQSSCIHDHSGSVCGVRVVTGELTETIFDLSEDTHVQPRKVNLYRAGFVCSSVDKDIHQITNHQDEGRELITLHIYSPPLATMHSYSLHEETDLHEAAMR